VAFQIVFQTLHFNAPSEHFNVPPETEGVEHVIGTAHVERHTSDHGQGWGNSMEWNLSSHCWHQLHDRGDYVKDTIKMTGHKRLWFEADAEPLISDVEAVLTTEAGGAFATLRYAWSNEGSPHTGIMLIHRQARVGAPAISWADSFHQSGALMALTCEDVTSTSVTGLGAYAAPPGPDWGWRIEVAWPESDHLVVTMANIWPSGQVDRAVAIELR